MDVKEYSLGSYHAFMIALGTIGMLVYYLLARTQGLKFATKLGVPVIILSLGYFPLVTTVPEYFGLLTLIGLVFVIIVAIQVRVSLDGDKE